MGYNLGMLAASLKGKKIAVVGLAREGMNLLHFFNKLTIKPVGLDAKTKRELGKNYRQLRKLTSQLHLGKGYLAQLSDFDIVFRSPGVPLDLPEIHRAQKRGVEFSYSMQLFFKLCPAKIIGVTGTKGKSTTATLIYRILKNQTKGEVYLVGNIGHPPLLLLPKLKRRDVVVVELSSFQLENLERSPQIAVVLNVTPEHLDRHKTFRRYLDAKSNIFAHQSTKDYLVASADYPATRAVLRQARGKTLKYSLRKVLARGLYLTSAEVIYRDRRTGKRGVLIQRSEVPLRGVHNLENVLAAMAVALLMKVPRHQIVAKIKRFRPLEHRLELVGKLDQVQFINDSSATTPIAASAALRSISGPVSLIMGGVSKGESLVLLAKALRPGRVKRVVLIGETAGYLARELKKYKVPHIRARSLKTAVEQAYRSVQLEGTVVLAPAFASFDMFENAYDRGAQFKKVVKDLIKKGAH